MIVSGHLQLAALHSDTRLCQLCSSLALMAPNL